MSHALSLKPEEVRLRQQNLQEALPGLVAGNPRWRQLAIVEIDPQHCKVILEGSPALYVGQNRHRDEKELGLLLKSKTTGHFREVSIQELPLRPTAPVEEVIAALQLLEPGTPLHCWAEHVTLPPVAQATLTASRTQRGEPAPLSTFQFQGA